MTGTNFSLFLLAALVIAVIPGPGIFYVAARTLSDGSKAGIASTFGTAIGGLVHVIAGALGVSAIILASAELFTALKLLGALYLIWLGIKTFRSEGVVLDTSAVPEAASGRSFFLRGFLIGASNPKALLFFAAFFPQFLNPALPFAPQFAILALTFVGFEFTVLTLYALGVSRIAPLLRASGPMRWVNRVCGGLFTLMGGLLLLTRRHT